MKTLMSKLSYLNIIISFIIIIIFNKELFIPKEGIASVQREIKKSAEERSLLLEWGTATWSGVILSSGFNHMKALTIIHEDSMKKIMDSKESNVFVTLNSGEKYSAKIKRWNSCNELALLEVKDGKNFKFNKPPNLELKESYLSESLFSFGHPLGLNLHYSEGYLSSYGNKIKPCGMITNGFSGGTIPGQTGSGVWNNNGELSGLIVATSAFPIKSINKDGEMIGMSTIPVTFLGRFIPSSEIKIFLK